MERFSGKLLAGLVATYALAGAPDQVLAQPAANYPTKPIRVVIKFPPGGGVDTVGRIVADGLTRSRGWSLIMDNRPGANGNIGTEIVAKSNPDGYTLLLTTNSHNINAFIYSNPGYDARKDLAAIVQLTAAPSVFIVGPKSPYRSLKDVVDAARAQPGKIAYGTSGSGSPSHVAGEMFKKAANIDLTQIPYKGGGPANRDVMAGQIPLGMAALPGVMSFLSAGRLRALAMTSEKRWQGLPDVPTVAESGYPGFSHETWIGALAPTGTPSRLIARLNREFAAVLAVPAIRERLLGLGAEPVGKSPAEFEAMLKAEYESAGKLVSEIGLKVQ